MDIQFSGYVTTEQEDGGGTIGVVTESINADPRPGQPAIVPNVLRARGLESLAGSQVTVTASVEVNDGGGL